MASQLALLDELDLEADNIRVALRHCLADPDGADLGLAMAAGLGPVLEVPRRERGRLLDRCASSPGAVTTRPSAAVRCYVKITLAVVQGDHAAGLDAVAEATAIARRLQDDRLLVRILANQAALQVLAGDLSAARATSAEATALAARLGRRHVVHRGRAVRGLRRVRRRRLRPDARRRARRRCAFPPVRRDLHAQRAPHQCRHGRPDAWRPRRGRGGVDRSTARPASSSTTAPDWRCGWKRCEAPPRWPATPSVPPSSWGRPRCCVEPSVPSRARSRCPLVAKAREQSTAVLGEARYNKAFEAGANLDREAALESALGKKVVREAGPSTDQNARSARQA